MKKVITIILCFVMIFTLISCESNKTSNNESKSETRVSGQDVVLTVKAYDIDGKKTFTLDEYESIGKETHEYSGRNKEQNNERQIREYTGVELKKIFEAAGHKTDDNDIIRIISSDGYTTEFVLNERYGLLAYKDNQATEGTEVPPMLAIIKEGEYMGNDKEYDPKEGTPLRFVYGQADYDSDTMKDFNMQNWASYVKEIQITKPE